MSAAPVREAATLVLLRDTSEGPETLLLRRHSKLAFAGGAWVFPGGAVEPDDIVTADEERTARRAAVRETGEECGLRVDVDQLVAFAHWTTPPESPRRYATWFFAACIDCDGTAVQVDGGEIESYAWYRPATALREHRAGRVELMPPTFITLTELSAAGSAGEVLARWRQRPVLRIEPRVSVLGDSLCMLYPGDAGYDSIDPNRAGVRHRCIMAADGWRYENDSC